jgi:hypothetical protein
MNASLTMSGHYSSSTTATGEHRFSILNNIESKTPLAKETYIVAILESKD